jgi:hypothetical protein
MPTYRRTRGWIVTLFAALVACAAPTVIGKDLARVGVPLERGAAESP